MITELFLFILMNTSDEITYKDIKPTLQTHCFQCHNESWPDRNWKDELLTKNNAQLIKKRVATDKNMPPGNFTGMKDSERELIKKWVDEGAK